MARHQVDLDELADAIDRLVHFEQQLETALHEADRLTNEMHVSWTGQAAEEHRHAHAQWRRGVEEMREALAVMRGIAGGAHANYDAAVGANSSMWRL